MNKIKKTEKKLKNSLKRVKLEATKRHKSSNISFINSKGVVRSTAIQTVGQR